MTTGNGARSSTATTPATRVVNISTDSAQVFS